MRALLCATLVAAGVSGCVYRLDRPDRAVSPGDVSQRDQRDRPSSPRKADTRVPPAVVTWRPGSQPCGPEEKVAGGGADSCPIGIQKLSVNAKLYVAECLPAPGPSPTVWTSCIGLPVTEQPGQASTNPANATAVCPQGSVLVGGGCACAGGALGESTPIEGGWACRCAVSVATQPSAFALCAQGQILSSLFGGPSCPPGMQLIGGGCTCPAPAPLLRSSPDLPKGEWICGCLGAWPAPSVLLCGKSL